MTKKTVVSDYKSVASFLSSLIQIIWVRIVLKFYFSLFISFLIKKIHIVSNLKCIEKLHVKYTEFIFIFPDLFVCMFMTGCPITSEYLSVYFSERTCSYITVIQPLKSGHYH